MERYAYVRNGSFGCCAPDDYVEHKDAAAQKCNAAIGGSCICSALCLSPHAQARHRITLSARANRFGGTFRPICIGGIQIDDQLKLGRLLDGQIGRPWRLSMILST